MDTYSPPDILFNRHLETIYPALFRKVDFNEYKRERIITQDSDFLDLDWVNSGSNKLVIISHGLEGNSTRGYMLGMAKAFASKGFDVLAWNYRGCSDEINKQLRFYHSGATDDLGEIISHAIAKKKYSAICLIGFSLGGNLTLKYLGEGSVNPIIKKAVAFSVPMHLHSSCIQLSKPSNFLYSKRFLKSLKAKVRAKANFFSSLDISKLESVKSLIQFDDLYTAPLHGFKNAIDYYTQSSSLQFLKAITIPTLIVNAANDPFLSDECYPVDLLKSHTFVELEIPERGGHVGFARFNRNGVYWSEQRALDFITSP